MESKWTAPKPLRTFTNSTLSMQVSLKTLDACVKRYDNWKTSDKQSTELESTKRKAIDAADAVPKDENLNNRKRMLRDTGVEPLEFAYERAIGKNDSVYSNFIDILNGAKSKVGRIVIKDGASVLGYATGFMV